MATLSQIEQRIANLQKKADDLRRKKSASVVISIKKMMADHGLSVKDLETDTGVVRKRGRPAGSKNGVHTAATIPAEDLEANTGVVRKRRRPAGSKNQVRAAAKKAS